MEALFKNLKDGIPAFWERCPLGVKILFLYAVWIALVYLAVKISTMQTAKALFKSLKDGIPGPLERYPLAVKILFVTGVWVALFYLAATISTMEKLCGALERGFCRPLRVYLRVHGCTWIIVTGASGHNALFHSKPFNYNLHRSHDPLPYVHHLALLLPSRL